ncbi:unnamed protein product [Auanema sp. JU1783]|nr:unnamed protein product [Auanema sp. JU1783]
MNPAGLEADPSNLTIILYEEDHTIGNSLKHVLCEMPEVEFCGYNVPHPLEDKILFRLQTKKGIEAAPILLKGFDDLEEIFAKIRTKFEKAYKKKTGSL